MEVKIAFDTEKESVDDLKRLVMALQDLISKREKSSSLSNPLTTANVARPSQMNVPQAKVEEKKTTPENYSGTGRIIPYEDMSGVLSKIVSGRKY